MNKIAQILLVATLCGGSSSQICRAQSTFGFVNYIQGVLDAPVFDSDGNRSERLAFPEKFGLIQPGYLPRFILTRHSPIERISNLNREKIVVFGGAAFETGDDLQFQGL